MIRHKLSLALAAWHPSDRSAKFMLLPWNNVFTKGDMDSFLVRNILPKLGQIMDEFIINPQHQVLGKFSLISRFINDFSVFGLHGEPQKIQHWRFIEGQKSNNNTIIN